MIALFLVRFLVAGLFADPGGQAVSPPGALPVAAMNQRRPDVIFFAQNNLSAAGSPVRKALGDGEFPWYDSRADRVQPVWPFRISWLEWLGERIEAFFRRLSKLFDETGSESKWRAPAAGDSIGTILLMAAIVAFLVGLAMLWVHRDRAAARGQTGESKLGLSARIADLPEGIRPEDSDPWAEAIRRRAAGDLAGAVVCLFAHQLLVLDQLGLIRLAPGRTGRHYLQSLRDRDLIDSVGATLALFEDVYYGRRAPTMQAFELVWVRGLAFQERRRAFGAGGTR